MKTFAELKKVSDKFFVRCRRLSGSAPWAVCVAMHEYARSIYPSDPYLPFHGSASPTDRLSETVTTLLSFLDSAGAIGSYRRIRNQEAGRELKARTGAVYGQLWSKFSHAQLTRGAADLLRTRLERNGIDRTIFRGRAIDVGCGSGRFTMALRRLGCGPVVGVDYGDDGLRVARATVRRAAAKGVSFRKCDVLNLPFPDASFDLVFCNGVLHHTSNMERGLREVVRLARPGGHIWLYLYGNGGIFWYARRRMPEVMKLIPQQYTMSVLDLLGMPRDRFIFTDNWYVPIERHCADREVRALLRSEGVARIERLDKGLDTDLEQHALHGGNEGKTMWGEGELRYVITK